jgi:putative membrane protein insertion efficiency factor
MNHLRIIQTRILEICCYCALVVGIILWGTKSSPALETHKMKAPLKLHANMDRTKPDIEHFSPLKHVMLESVHFFQDWVSPIDGSRCNFFPTCSRYGYEAVNNYGPFLGIIMTADRLMRCSHLTETEPTYNRLPNGKLHDPVANNLLHNP